MVYADNMKWIPSLNKILALRPTLRSLELAFYQDTTFGTQFSDLYGAC